MWPEPAWDAGPWRKDLTDFSRILKTKVDLQRGIKYNYLLQREEEEEGQLSTGHN